MCQLFALNCNAPTAVTFAFTGLSARGGDTGEHQDGFGLVFHDRNSCRQFIDDGRASDAALAVFLRSHPIRARTVIGHIRKATQGAVQLSNSHPFVREWQGRYWSFSHNGDLKNFHPRLDGSHLPVGNTDSELAFCWILQELRLRFPTGTAPGWRELAPALVQLSDELSSYGTFNFTLSDGEALYAYATTRLSWLQREHPFVSAHLVDRDLSMDLSLVNGPEDKMVLIATEPLTRNERWVQFAQGELRVFVDGDPVWVRTPSTSLGTRSVQRDTVRQAA